MMSWKRFVRTILCLCAVLATTAALDHPVRAGEQVEPFINGLLRRGMYEVANDYLDALAESRLVDDKIKQTIDYHKGMILAAQAKTTRDTAVRMKLLESARGSLEQFVEQHPQHALAPDASIQLGNILIERGRTQLSMAEQPSRASQRDALLAEGRALYEQAQAVFTKAEADFLAELEKFPKVIDPKDRDQIEAKNEARRRLMQSRLLSGSVIYEISKTYETGSNEHKKYLKESADKFESIYETYSSLLVGYYARMWQARSLRELGELKNALLYLDEVLAQPDSPEEFHELRGKALGLALECWIDETIQEYTRAIDEARAWLKNARGREDRSVDGLHIRWMLAQALELRANSKPKEGEEGRPAPKNDLRGAVKEAGEVARIPGDHRREAQEMRARLRDVELSDEPTTFAEARDMGRSEWDAMQAADGRIKIAQQTKRDVEKIAAWEKERDEARQKAVDFFRKALGMRLPDTPVEDVNLIRYYICSLLYFLDRPFESAVMGEFIAQNYPDSSGARTAAKVALASYLKLYTAASKDERDFESRQMVRIAEHIAKTWPGQPEADEAWMILGDIAIQNRDLEAAADYLSKIPDKSPKRSEADLKAGRALWGAYLSATRLPEDERPSAEQLKQMVQAAQEALQRGVGTMREKLGPEGEPDYTLLAAELSLAQLFLGSGQADKSVALLERPVNGPLALLEASNPTAKTGNLPTETYKAAMRSYVETGDLDKAEKMMDSLDKQVAESGKDEATLTRIYISLGRELKNEVERLQDEGKQEELDKITRSFELFLERIAKRSKGNTFSSLHWVAETFLRMGEGLTSKSAQSAKAEQYFKQAAITYKQLLTQIEQGNIEAQPASVNAVKVRRARCLWAMGEPSTARAVLAGVLAEKEVNLDAQVEAAYSLQASGAENPTYWVRAMNGYDIKLRGGTVGKVWGWANLAKRVQKYPNFRPIYHEARFNYAQCYFDFAMSKQGDEKTKYLKGAERAIVSTARLDPALGEEEWYSSYDSLLKKIRAELGQSPPKGIKQLVEELTAAAEAEKKKQADAGPSAQKPKTSTMQ